MSLWNNILQLGQKVLVLTKTTENHGSEIKKLQKQQLKLTREVIKLKQQLELEKQKNQQQKRIYQSEINRYKAELDNKFKDFEIMLLRAKIDAQSITSNNNQSNYIEPEGDTEK